jgi:hypothetical protein
VQITLSLVIPNVAFEGIVIMPGVVAFEGLAGVGAEIGDGVKIPFHQPKRHCLCLNQYIHIYKEQFP